MFARNPGLIAKPSSTVFNPRKQRLTMEDFGMNSGVGESQLTVTTSGGALSSNITTTDLSFDGSVSLSTSTSATGAASLTDGTNNGACVRIGKGRVICDWRFLINDLSTVGEEFIWRVGLGDTPGADQVDGIYLIYDRLTSVNWIMGTANNSTRTATASTVAVAEDVPIRARVDVNPAGTSVDYYINDVLLGSVTTNIPTLITRAVGRMAGIVKSAGTTARVVDVDYVIVDTRYTTLR